MFDALRHTDSYMRQLLLPRSRDFRTESLQDQILRDPRFRESLSLPNDRDYRRLFLGDDYQFGLYDAEPETLRQNAASANFLGQKGVELWRCLKSHAVDV